MWLEGAGYVPVNKNSAELESYQNAIAETPQLAVPGEVMMKANEAVLAPFVPNSDAVDTTIKDAMLMFGNGQALQRIQRQRLSTAATRFSTTTTAQTENKTV